MNIYRVDCTSQQRASIIVKCHFIFFNEAWMKPFGYTFLISAMGQCVCTNERGSRSRAVCFLKSDRHATLFGNSGEATPAHFIKHSFGSGKLGRCTAKAQLESDRGYFVLSINFPFSVYCKVAGVNFFFFLVEYSLYHGINFTSICLLYLAYCSRHCLRNKYAFWAISGCICTKTFSNKMHTI